MSQRFAPPSVSEVVKFRNQDFAKIRSSCSDAGVSWEDPTFAPDIAGVTWKRPWEISSSACLFRAGAETHDVRQGSLVDGYLAAALQALVAHPQLLTWVVPEDQGCSRKDAGVAHCRVWHLGTWYEVCVDDRLPMTGDDPAYTHSHDEFWCAVLEKAYAKLAGSYHAVRVGHSADTVVDLCGGISETILLGPAVRVGETLFRAYEKSLMICCTVGEEKYNARGSLQLPSVVRHFAVTRVQRETSGEVLVRVKDPVGDYTRRLTIFRDLRSVTNSDSEFWISASEFQSHFTTLSICHVTPDTVTVDDNSPTVSWWVDSSVGEWVRGVSAGGAGFETTHENYQYIIELEDPDDAEGTCSLVVSLMQQHKNRHHRWNVEFKIFRMDHSSIQTPTFGREFFAGNPHNFGSRWAVKRREMVISVKLLPGFYCVLPCTRHRGQEGRFLLRMWTRARAAVTRGGRGIGVVGTRHISEGLAEIRLVPLAEEGGTEEEVIKRFCKVAGGDLTLGWEGLKEILNGEETRVVQNSESKFLGSVLERFRSMIRFVFKTFTPSKVDHVRFSKELCRTLIAFKDEEKSGKIGFDEFDELWSQICEWKAIFSIHSNDREVYLEGESLSEALQKAGFVLNKGILGALIHRFADELGRFSFDDFIMCVVTLHLEITNFKKKDKDNCGKAVVTLDEWVGKSLHP